MKTKLLSKLFLSKRKYLLCLPKIFSPSFISSSHRSSTMVSQVSDIIKIYKDLACNPSPKTALLQISPSEDAIKVFSSWTIPDLVRSESTEFIREFLLQCRSKEFTLLSQGIPSDTSSASQFAFTKSGNKYAVFRKGKNDESVFLEIWNSSHKECTFDMSDRKEHGKVHYTGNLFQSLEWSANEKYLIYVAEMKKKKSESYFKDIFCQKTDETASEEITKGEENVYEETWGENYSNVHHTVLCIFEVETGKVEVVNLEDKGPMSVAQATWGPNDECIVFVAYKEDPFRLGVCACSNRSSSIFSYNLETKAMECLTPEENICVEYPVFSPNFEAFVFVQNKVNGPHLSCRKLMKYDWKKKELSTVIDIVENSNGKEFAGVYLHAGLSSKWWSRDSRYFFFHTFRRSALEIFYVDVSSKKIQKLNTEKFASSVLYDVQDPYILIGVSSPNTRPHLAIGYFCENEDGIEVTWSAVDTKSKSCNTLEDLSWDVHTLQPSLPSRDFDLDYEIVVLSSNKETNGDLILFPHGGPHSTFATNFCLYSAAFAKLGYVVCKVNYRGSLGFGENSVKSLLGHVGTQDVSDVVNAVEYLKKEQQFRIEHVLGFGGSHGGFLTAHLLGQFPDLLKAAVLRNPVIDLTSMAGVTDIPDWCWVESGCSERYVCGETTDASVLKEMWERSPIRYVEKVKSPTLLCIGKNDLRVPPSQGLFFHKQLKAQNVPTKVFFYNDNHSLSKVGVSSDAFVHIVLWFQKHSSS